MKGLNNLSICLLISFVGIAVGHGPVTYIEAPDCLTANGQELWPHPDPSHFWYCRKDSTVSAPIDLPCPAGRGFLRTTTRSGCIPYSDWSCRRNIREPSCKTPEEYNKLHRHIDPTKYYACPEPMGTPAKVISCFDQKIEGSSATSVNRVFVDNKQNYGCVPYDLWYCDEFGGDRE